MFETKIGIVHLFFIIAIGRGFDNNTWAVFFFMGRAFSRPDRQRVWGIPTAATPGAPPRCRMGIESVAPSGFPSSSRRGQGPGTSRPGASAPCRLAPDAGHLRFRKSSLASGSLDVVGNHRARCRWSEKARAGPGVQSFERVAERKHALRPRMQYELSNTLVVL